MDYQKKLSKLVRKSADKGLDMRTVGQALLRAGLRLTTGGGDDRPITKGGTFVVEINKDGESFAVQRIKPTDKVWVQPNPPKGQGRVTHDALEIAGQQFLFYAGQHFDKRTPESDVKAHVNMRMADLCFSAIERPTERRPVELTPDVPVSYHLPRAAAAIGGEFHAHKRLGTPEIPAETAQERDSKASAPETAEDQPEGLAALESLRSIVREHEWDLLPAGSDDERMLNEIDQLLDRVAAVRITDADIPAFIRAKADAARRRAKAGVEHFGHYARLLDALALDLEKGLHADANTDHAVSLRLFFQDVHGRNVKAGWWSDLDTGLPKKRSVGEMFMLMVTELAEAYDAYERNNAADDKLPEYSGLAVELGDLGIRWADFCGALMEGSIVETSHADNPGDRMFREVMKIAETYEAIRKTPEAAGEPETGDPLPMADVAVAIVDKMAFNANRPDHKIENRQKDGGKRT